MGGSAGRTLLAARHLNQPPEQLGPRNLLLELEAGSDPFSFAFGGVYPGRRGKAALAPREVHRVSYSVGVAGDYLLHVRLRSQAAAVPGSPFPLRVDPGPAYALSTALPEGPLWRQVGEPCEIVLQAADKMGNECHEGGGNVLCECHGDDGNATADCVDLGNGSYKVSWGSEVPCVLKGVVTIDGQPVVHSPILIEFIASSPLIKHSRLQGLGMADGLGRQAIVGERMSICITLYDKFHNQAEPTDAFRRAFAVGLALPERNLKGIAKAGDGAMHSSQFEGRWSPDSPSDYVVEFTPTSTAIQAVHLWCTLDGSGEQVPFPGSPYPVTVSANQSDHIATEVIDASGIMPGDYRADITVFDDAQSRWGICSIDAFASKATRLVSRFWSAQPVEGEKGCLGVDALAHPWPRGERIWAHPPIELLNKLVAKLSAAERQAEVLVVVPQHKTTRWYMDLLRLADSHIKFPKGRLERIAADAPKRLEEWPITIFHIAAGDKPRAPAPASPATPDSGATRRPRAKPTKQSRATA